MATENILVRLGLNASDYISGANKAEKATSGVHNAVLGFAKATVAAFGAREVVQFAGDSVRAFSDLQESLNAVEVSFGAGADQIKAFGETSAETVGLANAEFNQLSVTTGSLLQNFITDADEAADETIKLTQRAADMASVFNTDVSDALFAVQAGLRGETEPLRRFGVLLDDASIRAKAVELGLAATTKEVDRQAKGLAALDLVYEQTANTAGDFANTSDSIANQQRTLAARFEDTKALVGEALAPAFDTLLDVADELLPVLADLAPAFGAIGGAVGSLTPILGTAASSTGGLIATIATGASEIAAALGSVDAAKANALREATENVNDALLFGGDAATAYANSLAHLLRNAGVTTTTIEALGQGVEFTGQQQAVAIRGVLRAAQEQQALTEQVLNSSRDDREARRLRELADETNSSVRALTDAYIEQLDALDLTITEKQRLIDAENLAFIATGSGIVAVRDVTAGFEDYAVRAQEAADTAVRWAEFQDRAAASAENFDDGLDNLKSSVIDAAEAQRRSTARADELKGAYNRLESQTRKQADSQERANQALIDFQKRSLEAASPALQLLRAQERVTAAQEAANDAVKDFGPDSAEARDATIDLFEAQLELEGATLNAKGKVNDAEQALKDLAGPLGISEDLVRDLIEALDDLPTVTDLDVNVRFNQTGDNPGVNVPSNVGSPGVVTPGGNVGLDAPTGFGFQAASNTVQLFMDAPPDTDTFDQVSLALQLSGITEEIEMNPSFR